MPDPSKLRVGDYVRFVDVPDEWSKPGLTLPKEDRAFMKVLIKRRYPSRIYEIDERGFPWVMMRVKDGKKYIWHHWSISESTGWRRVKKPSS